MADNEQAIYIALSELVRVDLLLPMRDHDRHTALTASRSWLSKWAELRMPQAAAKYYNGFIAAAVADVWAHR